MKLESVESGQKELSASESLGAQLLTDKTSNAIYKEAQRQSIADVAAKDIPGPPQAGSTLAAEFRANVRDREFDSFVGKLDLNTNKFEFAYKKAGSTIGLKVMQDGDMLAKWSPKNGATNPEAQEVSHRLAQYMNVSDVVTPSAYYTLKGDALKQFRSMVHSTGETNPLRRTNRAAMIKELERHPNELTGVITPFMETKEVQGLQRPGGENGIINSAHPIAQLIQADKPMASDRRELEIETNKGTFTGNEKELAKQFSQMMVIDLLCGQYDRFSGGNIEATYDKEKGFHFLARDNGGASMSGSASKYVEYYKQIVSRFDRQQIQRVQDLVRELNGPNANDLVKQLHLKSDPSFLKDRAQKLLSHVKVLRAEYGDQRVFF